MSEKIIHLNEAAIKAELKELVRGSVEETLNELLEQAAEEAVGVAFPSELTALLSELNGDRWLLFSTKEIMETVTLNREALLECYAGIGRHIFFAGNGCGDCYCYNIDETGQVDDKHIYLWLHETNETELVATSITELIARYYLDELQLLCSVSE